MAASHSRDSLNTLRETRRLKSRFSPPLTGDALEKLKFRLGVGYIIGPPWGIPVASAAARPCGQSCFAHFSIPLRALGHFGVLKVEVWFQAAVSQG